MQDSEKLEYTQANEWWRTLSQMRRRDIALFTGAQGAILALIGDQLPDKLQADGYGLTAIAFIVALIGINNERRLYGYLRGFRKRAQDIETKYRDNEMSLIGSARKQVAGLSKTLGSSKAFLIYYGIIAVGWGTITAINVVQALAD